MDWPSVGAGTTRRSRALGALGVKVNITELDVDVLPPATRNRTRRRRVRVQRRRGGTRNPYVAGLPDSVQQALAERYADLFRGFHEAPRTSSTALPSGASAMATRG